MKRTPRHTLLRTAAALTLLLPALTACTIVSRTVPAADEPITFASFLPDVTKAGVVESAGDMSEFAVWGWHTAADAGATPTAIFNGERIYRDGTGATAPWTYDVPRFWVEGHYDFYALYPCGLTPEEIVPGGNLTLKNFNADGATDLMAAYSGSQYNTADPKSGAEVAFSFDHFLSRINIEALSENDGVTIKSLSFSGMYVYGSCTYNPNGADAAERILWNFEDFGELPDGVSVTGTFVPGSDIIASPLPGGERVSLLPDLLLIPQSPGAVCCIELTYTINDHLQPDALLFIPSGTTWEEGRQYTYTITFTTEGGLSIEVEDWITPPDYVIEW